MNKFKKINILVIAFCMVNQVTYAADGGFTEMASVLDSFIEFFTGRFAFFVCIGSWVYVLSQWAISDGGSNMLKTGTKLALVFAILFNLTTIAARLWGTSKGLPF